MSFGKSRMIARSMKERDSAVLEIVITRADINHG